MKIQVTFSENDAQLLLEYLDFILHKEKQYFEGIQKEAAPKELTEDEVERIFESFKENIKAIKRFQNIISKALDKAKALKL